MAIKRWILCIFTILSSLTVLARGENPVPIGKALAVMPGHPDTLAVCDSAGQIAIYDDGVKRPVEIASPSGVLNGMAFSPSGTELYGVGGPAQRVEVTNAAMGA